MNKSEKETKGSKEKLSYAVINLSKAIPTYPSFKKTTRGWITYGSDNLLPQHILDLNNSSGVNGSIIQTKVTYICGAGPDETIYYSRPNPNESWRQMILKLATDLTTFGGFCFQVIQNKDSKSVSLYHTDFSKIRIGEVNNYGIPVNYYLSNDWTRTNGQYSPVMIKAYGSEEMKGDAPYLFYYKDYSPGLDFYPIPSYYGAWNYIEADGLLGKFYKNSINSGFTPSVIITMPSNPGEEQKEQFNHDIKETFSGTNGANAIVVLWGESQDVKPVITPFNANRNSDVYNNVNDIIFQKIISAHNLTSPTLAGISGSGNLSGNANEIINSYILFSSTVIFNERQKILDAINQFIANNGLANLRIKDLDIVERIRDTNQNNTLTDE